VFSQLSGTIVELHNWKYFRLGRCEHCLL